MDYDNICTTVFTPLEYGCIGITEDEAEKAGAFKYTIYYCLYTPLESPRARRKRRIKGSR